MLNFRSLMAKLLAGFLLICGIGFVSSAVTFISVREMNSNIHAMETTNLPMLLNTADVTAKASEQVAQLRGYLLTNDPKALENYRNLYKQNKDLIAALESKAQSEQIKNMAKEVNALNDRYSEIAEKGVVPLKQAGKDAEAVEYARRPDVVASVAAFFSKLSDLRNLQKDDISNTMQKTIVSGNTTITLVLITTVISLIVGMLTGVFVARSITLPVKEMQQLMQEMAKGDLRVQGTVRSRDEIGQMVTIFNEMAKEQNRIMTVVRGSSDELAGAAEQMAASSQEVTSTTEEVATNMTNLAANTMHGKEAVVNTSKVLVQLSSLIQIAKERAVTAQANSALALESAKLGESTVNETIGRMDNISEQTALTEARITDLEAYSKKIELIADTITNIAGQTNLLALNAAIEAARAGEAGRGFAVVAEEVRKLAEQSNQGAEEVAGLIRKIADSTAAAVATTQQSRTNVQQGVALARNAGSALSKIVLSVSETVSDSNRILDITKSEVASSEQIVALIEDIASINDNNAASAEEVAAAAEEMSATMHTVASGASETAAKGLELKELVEKFKLAPHSM
ncbi:MAG TPA: methyl-accepting chemotaxis protein [Negativicutes bacterium]|nr:methyl-accepting chemotaxis protein [Negativicutes bacterium]